MVKTQLTKEKFIKIWGEEIFKELLGIWECTEWSAMMYINNIIDGTEAFVDWRKYTNLMAEVKNG